jgi:hypothetical protein
MYFVIKLSDNQQIKWIFISPPPRASRFWGSRQEGGKGKALTLQRDRRPSGWLSCKIFPAITPDRPRSCKIITDKVNFLQDLSRNYTRSPKILQDNCQRGQLLARSFPWLHQIAQDLARFSLIWLISSKAFGSSTDLLMIIQGSHDQSSSCYG